MVSELFRVRCGFRSQEFTRAHSIENGTLPAIACFRNLQRCAAIWLEMPRVCSVCSHAERVAIDQERIGGPPCRDISGRFGLSKSAVERIRELSERQRLL
jgi:hypothetical protein